MDQTTKGKCAAPRFTHQELSTITSPIENAGRGEGDVASPTPKERKNE